MEMNKEITIKIRRMPEKEYKEEKYLTKCVFCGKEFITIKNTANEGICYNCRCY